MSTLVKNITYSKASDELVIAFDPDSFDEANIKDAVADLQLEGHSEISVCSSPLLTSQGIDVRITGVSTHYAKSRSDAHMDTPVTKALNVLFDALEHKTPDEELKFPMLEIAATHIANDDGSFSPQLIISCPIAGSYVFPQDIREWLLQKSVPRAHYAIDLLSSLPSMVIDELPFEELDPAIPVRPQDLQVIIAIGDCFLQSKEAQERADEIAALIAQRSDMKLSSLTQARAVGSP